MEPVPLPVPYLGVNESVPVIALQSPNCAYMLNWNPSAEGLTLRAGDSLLVGPLGGALKYYHVGLATYGETTAFEVVNSVVAGTFVIYNLETSTIAYTSAAAGFPDYFQTLFFNNYLFFFTKAAAYAPGVVYNGAAFGAIGYTGALSGNFRPYGGDVFKSRAYLVQYNEPAYWYSDLYAIAGATTKVDLSTLITEKTTLSTIARITYKSSSGALVEIQAFVMFSGEVLFYQGSYPDSADWQKVGGAKVGQPLNWGSGCYVDNDYILFTETGPESLRDLYFEQASTDKSSIENTKINKTWNLLVQGLRATTLTGPITGIKGVWDSLHDRIIITFPITDEDLIGGGGQNTGVNTYFIFDRVLKSWYFHSSYEVAATLIDIAYYKNKVIFPMVGAATQFAIKVKEGNFNPTGVTLFSDSSLAGGFAKSYYTFALDSAPISNGRTYVQQCTGLDVIINSDAYVVTNYYLIKNFGETISSAQVLSGMNNATWDTPAIQKGYVNLGIEGSFIQYKISGATSAAFSVGIGTQLYGFNVWIESGRSPR